MEAEPTIDGLTALEYLETVAGERCPCGHMGNVHGPPTNDIETWGACSKCPCMGLIDAREDDDA